MALGRKNSFIYEGLPLEDRDFSKAETRDHTLVSDSTTQTDSRIEKYFSLEIKRKSEKIEKKNNEDVLDRTKYHASRFCHC